MKPEFICDQGNEFGFFICVMNNCKVWIVVHDDNSQDKRSLAGEP